MLLGEFQFISLAAVRHQMFFAIFGDRAKVTHLLKFIWQLCYLFIHPFGTE